MDINQTVSLILLKQGQIIFVQIVLATEAERRLHSITWENKRKWKCVVIDLERMLYDRISGILHIYKEAYAEQPMHF